MEIVITLLIILLTSIVIYYAGNYFAESSSKIGDHLRLPRSVKGATFDAIASSFPELLVALFSVVFFQKFEVGIGTIAGSALFNLLVIPGISVLVAPVVFKVSKKVISRDAIFYIIAVFVLVVISFYFKSWGTGIALVLLSVYLFYLFKIMKDSIIYRRKVKKVKKSEKIGKEILIFLSTMLIMGIATYFLTQQSIILSEILKVSPIVIAFTITAAATSIPDTVISVVNAKKGDISDATSNVFGSNIFDICIGLGLPLLIYTTLKGSIQILFTHTEILFGLLGTTIMVLYFFAEDEKLNKKQGWFLLFLYIFFITYTIILSK